MRRPSSTTAAAVSSHDVSIPRILNVSLAPGAPSCRTAWSPSTGLVVDGIAGDLGLELAEERRVLGCVHLVDPHHERVLVGLLVVALADSDRREAEPAVQVLGALVRQAHLEGHVLGTARDRLAREPEEQAGAD